MGILKKVEIPFLGRKVIGITEDDRKVNLNPIPNARMDMTNEKRNTISIIEDKFRNDPRQFVLIYPCDSTYYHDLRFQLYLIYTKK